MATLVKYKLNSMPASDFGIQEKPPMINQQRSTLASCTNKESVIPLDMQTKAVEHITSPNKGRKCYENYFLQSKENPNFGEGVVVQTKLGCNLNPKMNLGKMRRMLINRRSTHRARQQRLESMEKLKRKIVQEKAKVRMMHLEVCGHELEIRQLEKENHALEQQLEVLLNVKAQKQVEYQAMMQELDKYKHQYTRMNERK